MAKRAGRFFERIVEAEALDDQKHHIIEAPDDKVVAGAVPQTGQEKDDDQIEVRPPLPFPAVRTGYSNAPMTPGSSS